jgi:hypothetical protein
MGTGHYYFEEMRSSFNFVQNQLFALKKLNIYKTKLSNLSNCTSSSAEKGNVKKKSMKLRFLRFLTKYVCSKKLKKLKA